MNNPISNISELRCSISYKAWGAPLGGRSLPCRFFYPDSGRPAETPNFSEHPRQSQALALRPPPQTKGTPPDANVNGTTCRVFCGFQSQAPGGALRGAPGPAAFPNQKAVDHLRQCVLRPGPCQGRRSSLSGRPTRSHGMECQSGPPRSPVSGPSERPSGRSQACGLPAPHTFSSAVGCCICLQWAACRLLHHHRWEVD